MVRFHHYHFEAWAISFTPLCLCLSEAKLKVIGPFYLVSMPEEVKYISPVSSINIKNHSRLVDPGCTIHHCCNTHQIQMLYDESQNCTSDRHVIFIRCIPLWHGMVHRVTSIHSVSTDDLLNHSVNITYSLPANSMSTRHSREKQKKLDHALKDGAYFPHLSSAFLLSRKVVSVICSCSF